MRGHGSHCMMPEYSVPASGIGLYQHCDYDATRIVHDYSKQIEKTSLRASFPT